MSPRPVPQDLAGAAPPLLDTLYLAVSVRLLTPLLGHLPCSVGEGAKEAEGH